MTLRGELQIKLRSASSEDEDSADSKTPLLCLLEETSIWFTDLNLGRWESGASAAGRREGGRPFSSHWLVGREQGLFSFAMLRGNSQWNTTFWLFSSNVWGRLPIVDSRIEWKSQLQSQEDLGLISGSFYLYGMKNTQSLQDSVASLVKGE